MLDDVKRKELENTLKKYKKNMIKSFRIKIDKLSNNINVFSIGENKISNAKNKIKYKYLLIEEIAFVVEREENKQQQIQENITKLKEEKQKIISELKNLRKEIAIKKLNNPDLQIRINQSPIRLQNFIDAANQEHIPNNSNGSNSFLNAI
ncbi:MAG: hypothetical protein PPFGHCPK_00467 [Spiroplasma endosymbiont of Drosophila atripex]|nr:MAG: hypothetical protein PPFGHCPK_00467 [Spiroplasma endosymbiont of Drosophila atripex]